MSVKRNNQDVKGIDRGVTPVRKMYRGDVFVFGASGSTQPCFEVVNTLSAATGNYVDVYNKCDEKWYKKNNLSQYEEYGIMPTVDSLTGVTYYVGKKVILSTDSHEYKWTGSAWSDLGGYIYAYTEYEYVQGNGTSRIVTDYYANDNTWAAVDIEGRKASAPNTSTGESHPFGSYHDISGQGISHRFKWLYPGSGTAGQGGIRYDYKGITQQNNTSNLIINRGVVKLKSDGGYINDTKLISFSDQSSTSLSGNMCPIGIFQNLQWDGTTVKPQSGSIVYDGKMYSVKIYEGDTLVRNYVPATKNGAVGFYDTVNDTMWSSVNSTPFTVGGSSTEHGSVPEPYDTKVAPPDNVSASTLSELEMMECPWVGMNATVAGVGYIYTPSGWTPKATPCFEVVSVLSGASGDYVDVYNSTDEKWYKKNNLNQYEQYGIMPTVDSLAGVAKQIADGYTQLDYVESSGNSSVNLGVQLFSTAGASFEVESLNEPVYTSGGENLQTVIACQKEISPYPGFSYRFDNSGVLNVSNSTGGVLTSDITNVSGSTYNVTVSVTSVQQNITSDYPLVLFSGLDSTKTPFRFCKGKVYTLTVKYNNTLVRNLVPAKRNSDNVAGLYDTVNDVFYTSSNEHPLVSGNEIMEGLTYYVGKLVILSTDSHEYRWNGTTWVDLGEATSSYTEYEYVQGNGTSYINSGYYPKDNTTILLENSGRQAPTITSQDGASWPGGCSTAKSNNSKYKLFGILYPGYGSAGTGGIRFDYRDKIDYHNNTDPKIIQRAVIKMDISGGYLDNNKLVTFSNGSSTLEPNYAPLAFFTRSIYSESTGEVTYDGGVYGGKIYNVKLYEGETLVREYVPATKNGVVGMYETVNGVMYGSENSTPFTVGGSSTEHGSVPVDYDTKVAPANNVHYDTLMELELGECPWIGMRATVGPNNDNYTYTENGWELNNRYVTFDLNNGEWTGSTYTFTDYNTYMSVNEKNMDGYKCMKVEWYGYPEFYIDINSYSYWLGYQYTVAMNMDGDKPTSMPSYNSSGVKYSTYSSTLNPNTLNSYKHVYYPNDGDVHHAWIVYRQSSTTYTTAYDNKGYIAVLDYDNIESLEYRTAQSEYYDAGSGVYYAKDYQWYSKDGTNFSQSNNWKQGEQLQTVDRVSQTEYLGSNGTYYYKVYKDVVTPDNVQRSTGYYVMGAPMPTTYVDSQTEYVGGNGYYYAKSYCYVTTPDNVIRNTGYYTSGQELAVSGGTWAGETMIDHSDDKRYKLLPAIVTLLNGTTVQPSSFAELKGDYIEDVTYSVPSGYTQCDWIGTTRNSIYYTTKSQISIKFSTYLTVLGSDDITIKSYIPYDQKVSSYYYVSTFGTSGLGLRCKENESTQNQMLIAWNGQNLVFGNSSNYIMYPLFDKVGELRFNAYGVEHKSYSANTATSLNSEIAAQGTTLPLGTSNSYNNLYMFIRNDDMQNNNYANSLCRLYGMIIKDYQTQTIKHNYVPSFNNNTNKLGLYDLIDNIFFPVNNDTNAGFASDDTIIEGTTSGYTDFYIGSNGTSSATSTNSIKCHVVVTGTGINKFYAKLEDCNGSIKRIYSISSGFASTEGKKVLSIDKWTYPGYVESMERCFWGNTSIKRVDFRKLETNKLTNIVVLFGGCENLEQVNLEGFRNSKISNLQAMFSGCKKITNIDMSMFSYPLTSLLGTFQDCRSLTTLDIRNFDTTNTSTFSQIFANCTSLNKLYLGSGYFNSIFVTEYDFSPLSAWTDTESLAMFVTAITAHDGTGKTVYLSSQTKAALTQAQKDAITAAGWTIQ